MKIIRGIVCWFLVLSALILGLPGGLVEEAGRALETRGGTLLRPLAWVLALVARVLTIVPHWLLDAHGWLDPLPEQAR